MKYISIRSDKAICPQTRKTATQILISSRLNAQTVTLQRGKSLNLLTNETFCWPWVETHNTWECVPSGWAVRYLATWFATLSFASDWARRVVGEARLEQSAGHVIVKTVFFKLFWWQTRIQPYLILKVR